MKLFLLLISYVIFPVCLPDVLFGAEQECFYSCCLVCQHDPCLCSMPLDDMPFDKMVTPETDAQQQPMQGKRYQCTYPGCEATCKYPGSLKKHRRIHTGERPYKCQHPGCGRAFTQSSELTVHKRTHTGEKPYKCPHPGCKYATAYSSSLIRHNFTHTGERPYKCPYPGCEYAATDSSDLTDHKRIHTGEKPYKCDSCEGEYRRLSHLKEHLKKIHGIEIPPKKVGRPPKRTQKNLDSDEAGAPEDQEAKQVHRGNL